MITELEQVGGLICLDFANTVGPRRSRPDKEAHDYLVEFTALVGWSEQAGTVAGNRARLLLRRAHRHQANAAEALASAVALRESIYEVFAAVACGEDPPAGPLAQMQTAYAEAMAHAELLPTSHGLDWSWSARQELRCVLWPIARSAAEAAITADFSRIKQCPGHDGSCGWLFYDTSKNGLRRWCSMQACGTWEKTRRHTERRSEGTIGKEG